MKSTNEEPWISDEKSKDNPSGCGHIGNGEPIDLGDDREDYSRKEIIFRDY